MPSFYDDKISEVLPDVTIHFNLSIFVCIVLLPMVVFSILAVLYSYLKMKRPPLELIMMAGIGVVLTITTLILSVSTVVKGNTKAIAMLRVFGYSDCDVLTRF